MSRKAEYAADLERAFGDLGRAAVLGVDPGGWAVLSRHGKRLLHSGCVVDFLLEGWCASNARAPEGGRVIGGLEDAAGADILLFAARSEFHVNRAMMRRCARMGLRTMFVFDSWKNHRLNFVDPVSAEAVFPDKIGVIDAHQKRLLLDELSHAAPPGLEDRVMILGHPALEEQARAVMAIAPERREALRARLGASGRTLRLFLTEPVRLDYRLTNGLDPGYDEFSSLELFLTRHVTPGELAAVKLHPRQHRTEIARHTAAVCPAGVEAVLADGPLEDMLACADHVYGMTSTALHVAIAAGLPVTSIQNGRNAYGETLSHPALEARLAL
jgi:hypothetical protein